MELRENELGEFEVRCPLGTEAGAAVSWMDEVALALGGEMGRFSSMMCRGVATMGGWLGCSVLRRAVDESARETGQVVGVVAERTLGNEGRLVGPGGSGAWGNFIEISKVRLKYP